MTICTSRRSFLKSTALAGLCAAPMASTLAREYSPQMHWDETTDVLVIGFGGSGAVTAVTAHDLGKKVLIIEKMPAAGGNTAVSAGGFMCPDDIEKAYKYLKGSYEYGAADYDEKLLKTFARRSHDLNAFIQKLDPEAKTFVYGYAGFKGLEGAEVIKRYRVRSPKGAPRKGSGDCLFDVLQTAVEKRGIPVWLESPAVNLIKRGNEVLGAVVQKNGKKLNVRANLGVVLCTGGYEFDKESLMNFTMGKDILAMGNPGNTGDGLRLAQSAGAKLWHMQAYSATLAVKFPGLKTAVGASPKGPGYIWVDQDGKRFVNELVDGHCRLYVVQQIDSINHRFPRIPCFLVFDQDTLNRGSLGSSLGSGYAINREKHVWTKDLAKEVEIGVVKKADTIAELAKSIGVPEKNLEKTIAKWNADMKTGEDSDFGRAVKGVAKSYAFDAPVRSGPIEKGPFYAIALYPTLVNTQGGPRRNDKSQVLNGVDGIVPRLYVAGELGSRWGPIYQGACNNAESLVFGQVAGENVCKEKPWS